MEAPSVSLIDNDSGAIMDNEIIFSGTDSLTSGAFIRAIRQQSMAQGKQDDDRWIAQLAAGYLDGQALNWYEQQDEETQESWKLLRRGLLQRWNPEREASLGSGPWVRQHGRLTTD